MRAYQGLPSGTVSRARGFRRDATDAERALWRGLRAAFPEAKFRRQSPVGPYFADFLSFSTKLIIEADGGQHGEAAAYDARRTRYLEEQGYRVLRFWNNEILHNMDGVLTAIGAHLPSPTGRGASGEAARGEGDQPLRPSPSPGFAPRSHPLPVGEGFKE